MLKAPILLDAAIIGKSKQSCISPKMSEINKPMPQANLSPLANEKARASIKIPQLAMPIGEVKNLDKLIANIVGMGISILKLMN